MLSKYLRPVAMVCFAVLMLGMAVGPSAATPPCTGDDNVVTGLCELVAPNHCVTIQSANPADNICANDSSIVFVHQGPFRCSELDTPSVLIPVLSNLCTDLWVPFSITFIPVYADCLDKRTCHLVPGAVTGTPVCVGGAPFFTTVKIHQTLTPCIRATPAIQ